MNDLVNPPTDTIDVSVGNSQPCSKNFTREVAQLFEFVGAIGQAIRMLSAYNPSAVHNVYKDLDVMWLSDVIHNFQHLGRSLRCGTCNDIYFACEMLSLAFKSYLDPIQVSNLKSNPADTFVRNNVLNQLTLATEVIEKIKTLAMNT